MGEELRQNIGKSLTTGHCNEIDLKSEYFAEPTDKSVPRVKMEGE